MSNLLNENLNNCRCIFFKDIKCSASIGIHPHELESKQELVINLEIYIKISDSASVTDNIKDTLDYDKINDGVIQIVNKKHYSLQETLIDIIADFCISQNNVKAVRVLTAKTQAYKNCGSVGIEVFKWNS